MSENNKGILYLVATPIGNLSDITLRALDILKNADIILVEDTRVTQKLLNHYQIESKKLISFHEHNEIRKIPEILRFLKDQSVALVSDGGTPTISDPGYKLVRSCLENSIKVISIPGASSIISALSSSGLPTDQFAFIGFLPRTKIKKQKLLEKWKDYEGTLVMFESPHRLIFTLSDLQESFGNQGQVVVAREMTKIHEEFRKETFGEVINHFRNKKVKGEIVILWHR